MDTIHSYLRDTLIILIERAKEAKSLSVREKESDPKSHSSIFQEGRALAYYEILNTIFGQAEVFGLSMKELGIEDFDPDHELLRDRKNKEGHNKSLQ